MKSANQIRRQYIDFFVKHRAHKEIPSASVIPENDPTVLFTTAGMHPLVPYLMGEPHPAGKRLVNVQKCVRTDDIDEVGDSAHLTFFEMLGNWSLGDYFKKEAIEMSFSLLTAPWEKGGYGLDSARFSVSCFKGDSDAPCDTESAAVWEKIIGIPRAKIYFYGKKENWWGPAGQTGPCGPDTEMFYDTVASADLKEHKAGWKGGGACEPSCNCGRYTEVWNDVFMEYERKIKDGSQNAEVKNQKSRMGGAGYYFKLLKQKNVDTGLGFERLVAILQGKESPFETELFAPAVNEILSLAGNASDNVSSVRIIADHLRAATFILGDPFGVSPSNVDQGYIVRRLVRRAVRHARMIGIETSFTHKIAQKYIAIYQGVYPELKKNRNRILTELNSEEARFSKTIRRGLHELHQIVERKKKGWRGYRKDLSCQKDLSGKDAFYIFESYGFPMEMIEEEVSKEGIKVNREEFKKAFEESFKKHQELSRAGSTQKFAGGLADNNEATTMHHTATHLLHQALRDVLGSHVAQKGSNVTAERLRFDFSHPQKMTAEELKRVEEIVNEKIRQDLPVHFEMLGLEEAKARGAIGLFEEKYAALGNEVKVYFIGNYSAEVCGGPHTPRTGVLKSFKIIKEQASSAGVRRIKAAVAGIKDV